MKKTIATLFAALTIAMLAGALAAAQVSISVAPVKPTVGAKPNEKSEWQSVDKPGTVKEGYYVRTGKEGIATLKWLDGNTLKLSPLTSIIITKATLDNDSKVQISTIELSKGSCLARVKKFEKKESSFTIKTPSATSGVRGTAFEVSVDDNNVTRVAAVEDSIFVRAMDVEITVEAGFMTEVQPDMAPSAPQPIPPEELEKLKEQTKELSEAPKEGAAPDDKTAEEQAAQQNAQDNADTATTDTPPTHDEDQWNSAP